MSDWDHKAGLVAVAGLLLFPVSLGGYLALGVWLGTHVAPWASGALLVLLLMVGVYFLAAAP